jgi:sugar phosphate isomerase/epimerase
LARKCWEEAIDAAAEFETDLVCGFAGRVRGVPIDQSIARFKEVFAPLAQRAEDTGVRLAFENCPMNGNWQSGDFNIAHNPDAWEMMFDAVPSPALGLEWEPCHQICQGIDPLPQLRRWVGKIFHVHGKDANFYPDVMARSGFAGRFPVAEHRHPGFGDTDWTLVISELRRGNFAGCIDIEGWHDPVYRAELELTGQVAALEYLKICRKKRVPNPEGF